MRLQKMTLSSASLAGFVLAAFAHPASAQMMWKEVKTKTSPPPRMFHATAYDSTRGRTVLFGGRALVQGPIQILGDTWEFDGSTWTQRTPTTKPPAKVGHAMTYDVARRVVVLFGGGKVWNSNETWEYDGRNWRQRRPKTSPPPTAAHGMVYDRARRVSVVFGGGRTPNETWEWDGTNWRRRLLASSPPGRGFHGMAYDVARGVVVLHGGQSSGGGQLNDTWEWDGNKTGWVQRFGARPPARWCRIVYDEARQRTVRYGNGDPTMEWDGQNWLVQSGRVNGARAWYTLVYDSKRQRVVLCAGALSWPHVNETWEYYSTYRGSATPVGSGCAGSAGIPTLSADRAAIIGNWSFRVRINSAKPNSLAFVGLALKPATLSIGGCTFFLDLASAPILIGGRSNGAGTLQLPLPIPFNPALRGFRLEAQGFISDPRGTYFRLLAFTNGLRLLIGD